MTSDGTLALRRAAAEPGLSRYGVLTSGGSAAIAALIGRAGRRGPCSGPLGLDRFQVSQEGLRQACCWPARPGCTRSASEAPAAKVQEHRDPPPASAPVLP